MVVHLLLSFTKKINKLSLTLTEIEGGMIVIERMVNVCVKVLHYESLFTHFVIKFHFHLADNTIGYCLTRAIFDWLGTSPTVIPFPYGKSLDQKGIFFSKGFWLVARGQKCALKFGPRFVLK